MGAYGILIFLKHGTDSLTICSIILVDSTRSGKRLPDALSKTIPIWCAVINRALLLRSPWAEKNPPPEWDTNLYTPPGAVSNQEHQQVEQRLDGWAESLAVSFCSRHGVG